MSPHLTEQQFILFYQRTIPSDEMLSISDHLAGCHNCRNRLNDKNQMTLAFTALQSDLEAVADAEFSHLVYEELEGYVDDKLDSVDREITESHLEICLQCKMAVQDLLSTKASLKNYLNKLPPKTQQIPEQSLRQKKFHHFQTLLYGKRAFQFAGLSMVLILFGLMAAKLISLQGQQHELERVNSDLQKQILSSGQLQQQLAQLQEQANKIKQDYKSIEANNLDLQKQLLELKETNALPSVAQRIVQLNDSGRLVVLDNQNNINGLEPLNSNYQQMVKTVLKRERVEISPTLQELSRKTGALMGNNPDNPAFLLLDPVGVLLLADSPSFRWQPLNGATGYTVGIYDAKFNEVATSALLVEMEWTLPHSLERGQVYYWQVNAMMEGEKITTPPAKFKIIAQSDLDELAEFQRTQINSHLVLGILYAKAGVLAEAESEFQKLLNENPSSPLVRKLLYSLKHH